MNLTRLTTRALAILVALAASPLSAESPVGDYRSKMEKWVETRQIISEERMEWEVERETLRATRDLLKQRKDALEAEISALEASHAESDDERRKLLLERGDFQRAAGTLEERIGSMESNVLTLAPRLPEPFLKKLEPLLVQIPNDTEPIRVPISQRLMNVLGFLAQAEKWNGNATFVGETRDVGDEKVQVRTLYWGLGQAFYGDSQGNLAGIGRPGPHGWEFVARPGLAAETSLLLDIYEGSVSTIEFVTLPVEIR